MTGILVVGGGIAGPAAALSLHRAGFDVTVYEAHPDTGADIGAFLTLAGNGMRALAQFGAAEIVAEIGFPVTKMTVLDATGTALVDVPLGEDDDPLTHYRCLRRAELASALRREVRRREIPLRHSARLVGITEDAAGITAGFADGTSATGDLLVGADGLHSAVRSCLDPAAGPSYAGQRVFYGYTTRAKPLDDRDRITMIRGSGAAFGCLSSPAGETFWFARVPRPPSSAEHGRKTAARLRDELLPLLRPDATPAADIVAETGEDLMVTDALHLSPGIRWRSGRAILIGDAAHAASPATGQGASMALEDAVVLAKALRDSETQAAGLERYELHRRPRVEQNIEVSAQLTASRAAPTPSAVGNAALAHQNRRPPRANPALTALLDWHTPLPAHPVR
ncbi:FAD-dependent oxidoreductase [Amycolatopsis pigmentata]|uniref:FAD-dependent oxidoreductase n=1 Tax=Amycolatopsis pigmentata TaxID=450801 RepID=A0ABW5FRJ5_9PSEU